MVIWLLGLSGSGKTTVGRILTEEIKQKKDNIIFLDGDILREVWGSSLSHDLKSRSINAERISKLCLMLEDQDMIVIAAVLSIFPEWQEWNRKNFKSYFEIFLDVPIEEVIKRDPKKIYHNFKKGKIKNVVGLDIDFPRPSKSNLIISGKDIILPPNKIVEKILSLIDLG